MDQFDVSNEPRVSSISVKFRSFNFVCTCGGEFENNRIFEEGISSAGNLASCGCITQPTPNSMSPKIQGKPYRGLKLPGFCWLESDR